MNNPQETTKKKNLTFSKVKKQTQTETDSKSLQYDYLRVLQLRASDEDEILRQHDI